MRGGNRRRLRRGAKRQEAVRPTSDERRADDV